MDTARRPDPATVWKFDPMRLSLAVSAKTRQDQHRQLDTNPFCAEVGRRLLLMQLQSSDWILRRVEKLDMSSLEGVRRDITLELLIPPDAPVFVDADDREVYCVPLSLMRRRTLVGLDIRDEHDEPVTIPGIRLTQQLDQALLLAAASSSKHRPDDDTALVDWIARSVSGTRERVHEAYLQLEGEESGHAICSLREDPLFMNVAQRLKHNFTLYLFLDADRRHRLIHLSFEEPSDWRYQKPTLTPLHTAGRPPATERRYQAGRPSWSWRASFARLGLVPQRIRFQVPGAESASSYHFELSAPPGVRIVRATLLAGRPNEPKRGVSFDEVRGHTPTVALHAVEVPNGSLCRVQADLCLSARGYLGTMLVANIAMVLLLGVVVFHADSANAMEGSEVTNVILFLVSAVAAAAALVAQGAIGGLAGRFVSGIRVLTTVALGFPVVAAVFLTFEGHPTSLTSISTTYDVLVGLFVAAILIGCLTLYAWLGSALRERAQLVRESPWDMTRFDFPIGRWEKLRARLRGETNTDAHGNFEHALLICHFDSSAVGVASAEGWHYVYSWDDVQQRDAVQALEANRWVGPAGRSNAATHCHGFPTVCAGSAERCPSALSASSS